MSDQHKNDTYGDIDARNEDDAGVQPPIPSATVVLLRDGDAGREVLMVRKNSKISFGGMWVFPGGKIDAEDFPEGADVNAPDDVAALNAAVREAEEETGLDLDTDDLTWFSHWVPPPGPQKRFRTWFFVGAPEELADVKIDDGEIKDHDWIDPEDALARHASGDIDLAPPTWVTLYHLTQRIDSAAVIENLAALAPRFYSTRVAKRSDGVRVAMWDGDAGYEGWDADKEGARHRLVMEQGGFQFENDSVKY